MKNYILRRIAELKLELTQISLPFEQIPINARIGELKMCLEELKTLENA